MMLSDSYSEAASYHGLRTSSSKKMDYALKDARNVSRNERQILLSSSVLPGKLESSAMTVGSLKGGTRLMGSSSAKYRIDSVLLRFITHSSLLVATRHFLMRRSPLFIFAAKKETEEEEEENRREKEKENKDKQRPRAATLT